MKQRIAGNLRVKTQKDSVKNNESGFSLVEVVIAMVILLIVLLGVFITFAYAVNYNAGNSSRSQALTILQQEVEVMRSAKFTPQVTDSTLTGGTKAVKDVTSGNGNLFKVSVTVDDDPSPTAPGIQIDATKTVKEVTVTVNFAAPTPGWQTAVPAVVVLRRARAN